MNPEKRGFFIKLLMAHDQGIAVCFAIHQFFFCSLLSV